jgi:hypothetical protein
MIPMTVPFAKADLASQVLWMCQNTWQDQFNFHENGMIPVDISLLFLSLEAVEYVSIKEKSNAQSNEKASHKGKKRNKRPDMSLRSRFPRKLAPRSIATSAKRMDVPHTIPRIVVGMRKTEQKNLISAPLKRRKETHSHKAPFCAAEQEDGPA